MKSPLPMADVWAGTLEPGNFPVPSEEQHHHVSGCECLPFLTTSDHFATRAPLPVSCAMAD